MLEYFTLILVCQLIGELTVTALDLPIPGPVLGMVLLFLFLVIKGHVPDSLGTVSASLLNHLSLLFVPAGVGVMVHIELLGADILPLSVALVASTILTIIVTAVLMVTLNKLKTDEAESEKGSV